MNSIIKKAGLDAALTALYVVMVASFFYFAPKLFGPEQAIPAHTFIIPIMMMLLLVVSVAITGFFVFGYPAMWFLGGKKKEALQLLGFTLAFLFVGILLAATTLLLLR